MTLMARGQDFDPQQDVPELPQSAPPGQATDMSQQSGLRRAWDSWTSRPENNAAMINFGLNMMNPAPGNFLQGLSGAIGAGAEGMSANVKKQEERQQYEEAQALKEEEQARKEEETGYYGEQVRSLARQREAGGANALRKLSPLEIALKGQQTYQKWAGTPSMGMKDDYVDAYNRAHPEFGGKLSKAEIMANPQHQKAMIRMMTPVGDQYTGGILGTEQASPGGGEGGGAAIPPGARPVYDANGMTGYYKDGRFTPTR